MKLRGNKRLAFTVNQEFIDRFVEAKTEQAKHSRRAASNLEQTLRTLANAPTVNMPPGPPKVIHTPPVARQGATNQAVAPATPTTPKKIEPQKLTIGSGYTSVI